MAEGPELITNGDFTTDFGSWTEFLSGNNGTRYVRRSAPNTNMESEPGRTLFPPPVPPQPAAAVGSQPFTVTVDTDYILRFDVDTLSTGTITDVLGGIATSANDPPLTYIASTPMTSLGAKSVPFTSPGSGTTLYARHAHRGNLATVLRSDNWSVKEQNVGGDFRPIVMFY